MPCYFRGNVKRIKGDADGAKADCTKAIELNPQYPLAYHVRGCMRYDLRDNADALLDFRKELEVASSSDYAGFRIWLTRARKGEAEAATAELQTYLAGRSTGKPQDWPSKIGHFLAGQLAELDFLAAAQDADARKAAGQLCEANFYVASKHLLADDQAAASDYFEKSISTARKDFVEYSSAVADLKLLNAEKK